MAIKHKSVKAGGWKTLESYWNATGTAFFLSPKDAKVRIRYGGSSWWNGYSSQQKTLDGITVKKLEVGIGSLLYARLQMSVKVDTNVTYDIYPGSVAAQTPEFAF